MKVTPDALREQLTLRLTDARSAEALLTAAEFSRGWWPNFDASNAEEYWNAVFSGIGAGREVDGFERLTDAFRRAYPNNVLFRNSSGEGFRGRTAGALTLEVFAKYRLFDELGKVFGSATRAERLLMEIGFQPEMIDKSAATPSDFWFRQCQLISHGVLAEPHGFERLLNRALELMPSNQRFIEASRKYGRRKRTKPLRILRSQSVHAPLKTWSHGVTDLQKRSGGEVVERALADTLSQMTLSLEELRRAGFQDPAREFERRVLEDLRSGRPRIPADAPNTEVQPPSRPREPVFAIRLSGIKDTAGAEVYDAALRIHNAGGMAGTLEQGYYANGMLLLHLRNAPNYQGFALSRELESALRNRGHGNVEVACGIEEYRDYLLGRIYSEGPDHQQYELRDVPASTPIGDIVRGIISQYSDNGIIDAKGKQRPVVVDILLPDGSARRLNRDLTLYDLGIAEGATLAIHPESIAG